MRVCQFRHFGLETFIPLGVRLWNSSRTAVGRAAYILSLLRDLPVNVRSLVETPVAAGVSATPRANSQLHMLAAYKPRRSRPML